MMTNPHNDHKIDDSDAQHVFNYTSHSFKLNDILYYGDEPEDDDLEKIINLQKTLAKPAKYSFKVFTGLKWNPVEIWEHQNASPNESVEVHLPAFTSTSTDKVVAYNFARSFPKPDLDKLPNLDSRSRAMYNRHEEALNVLEIEITPGTEIGSVMHVSKHRAEKEMIINSGTTIEIKPNPSCVEHDGFLIIVWNGVTKI